MRWLFCLLLFLLGTAHADEQVSPLRVGMFTEFSPLAFEVAGELQGIEVDLAALIAARLGRPLEISTYAFPELLVAVEEGAIDIAMSGLSITPERAERVSFTNPYMRVGQMAIVRLEDAATYGKPNALQTNGLKIGVQEGGTGEAYVLENYKTANMIAYPGVESGLEALRNGNVDVFIHDSTTSWQLDRSFVNDHLLSLNRYLTEENIAWAVHKDNRELLVAVNLILQDLKEKGALNEVLSNWLPEYKPL